MTLPQGIWFVQRSHREGPLGKRVRRVVAPSILAWFQGKIEDARTSLTPHRVADADLGGPAHKLAGFFEAAKKHSLHTPKTTAALAKLLHEHLQADDVRADGHSVRVLGNDDDGEIAWFLFDDEAEARLPRNLAYLTHDEPRLPDGDGERSFAAAPIPALGPAGEGEGATYACLFTSYGRRSLAGRAVVISGVRLPELCAHLRRVTPAAPDAGASRDGLDGWPVEMRVLRAMIDADDAKLTPALERSAAYPLAAVLQKGDAAQLGAAAHDAARAELTAAAEGLTVQSDAEPSIVFEGEHAALLAVHAPPRAGYEQWIFFDDCWAAANPDLATSILHCAEHADPFAPLRPARTPAAAKAAKAEKATAAAKGEKGARKAKSSKAASKDEQAWKTAVGDRDVADALGYRPSMRFDTGGLVSHAKFGVGVVTRTEHTKCEVLFKDGPRLLVHGVQ